MIAALKADGTVSSLSSDRIYADNPPQDDVLPIVVLSLQNTRAFAAVNNCVIKTYEARVTVDTICRTRAASEALQESIEDALAGFTSSDSTHPIEGILVDSGASWQVLEPIDGSDEFDYWCSQDFMINYRRV